MKVWSESFENGDPIPTRFAFGKHNPESHVELSENENPHVAWGDLPNGTRSLVLLCHDVDVPSKADDVNKEGRLVPADLPRVDFYHWVLVDLDPGSSPIGSGEFSKGVTARGKSGPDGHRDTRSGLNDYTQWFEGDDSMAGQYFGYDGPCPPWNDSIVHHYRFTLYALDVARCPVDGTFTGPDVLKAVEGHILDSASFDGTYKINPDAR